MGDVAGRDLAAVADERGDEALLGRAQQGESAAFGALVDRYTPQVYALAYRLLGRAAEAEDAVQETFLKAYTSLHRFRREASFATWLYRIAFNVCLDELKRRGRRPELLEADGGAEADSRASLDGSFNPQTHVEQRERQEIVQRALLSLPPNQRAVLILADLQGLSYEEIAAVTGAKAGTVKSRLNRARMALKDLLAPHRELLRGD